VNSSLPPTLRDALIRWSDSKILDQLPLSPGAGVSLKFDVTGISDSLSADARRRTLADGCADELARSIHDYIDESTGVVTFELLVLIQYSGGRALSDGYCRQSAVSLCVEVTPAVHVTDWKVKVGSSDGTQSCRLVLDVVNVCDLDLVLITNVGKDREHLARQDSGISSTDGEENPNSGIELSDGPGRRMKVLTGQRSRVSLSLPLCDVDIYSRRQVTEDARPYSEEESLERVLVCHINSSVNLRWTTLTSDSSAQRTGSVYIRGLHFSLEDCSRLQRSPVTWTVSINGVVMTQSEGIGAALRCQEPVRVEVSLANSWGRALTDIELLVEPCQHTRPPLKPSQCAPLRNVVCAGTTTLRAESLDDGATLVHSCTFLFPWSGMFQLMCVCTAGEEVTRRVLPVERLPERQEWCHVIAIEMSDSEITFV